MSVILTAFSRLPDSNLPQTSPLNPSQLWIVITEPALEQQRVGAEVAADGLAVGLAAARHGAAEVVDLDIVHDKSEEEEGGKCNLTWLLGL